MSDERPRATGNKLWEILVETVHALPMYRYHKRYIESVLLKEKPGINAEEIALLLNIPLGEAMVILKELKSPNQAPLATKPTRYRATGLFDFEKTECQDARPET